MEKNLKIQYTWALTAIYIGALLLVAVVHWGLEETFKFSLQLGEQALVVVVIMAFGGVLSNILPNKIKYPLVYWRFRNALSGHRCRRICEKDSRIDLDDCKQRWPEMFDQEMKEEEQNVYWFNKIYRPVKNAPEVLQAHRHFLLFRDAAAGLFLLLVGILLWKLVGKVTSIQSISIWAAVVVAGMFVLVSQAARQSGDRMVANAVVIALGNYDAPEKA